MQRLVQCTVLLVVVAHRLVPSLVFGSIRDEPEPALRATDRLRLTAEGIAGAGRTPVDVVACAIRSFRAVGFLQANRGETQALSAKTPFVASMVDSDTRPSTS